jgi:hypothetical protein
MDFEKYMLPCLSKKLFGISCLSCGTQRAFFLILEGEYESAFFLFPPIYTTILFFSFIFLHFFDKARNYHKIIISLAIINAILMIGNYIFKTFYH